MHCIQFRSLEPNNVSKLTKPATRDFKGMHKLKVRWFSSKLSLLDLSASHTSLFDSAKTQNQLVDALQAIGSLKTPAVIDAFRRVDRALFIRDTDTFAEPYRNVPVKISQTGATMSTPEHHALIAETLWNAADKKKERLGILDVGCGSGYLLSLFASLFFYHSPIRKIDVTGVEAVEQLIDISKKNLKNASVSDTSNRVDFEVLNAFEGDQNPQWNRRLKSDSFDVINVGFSTTEDEIINIFGSRLNPSAVILAPIIKAGSQEQIMTLFRKMATSDMLVKEELSPALCQMSLETMVAEDTETLEEKSHRIKTALETWKSEFEITHGRKPNKEDMMNDPVSNEMFRQFVAIRRNKW